MWGGRTFLSLFFIWWRHWCLRNLSLKFNSLIDSVIKSHFLLFFLCCGEIVMSSEFLNSTFKQIFSFFQNNKNIEMGPPAVSTRSNKTIAKINGLLGYRIMSRNIVWDGQWEMCWVLSLSPPTPPIAPGPGQPEAAHSALWAALAPLRLRWSRYLAPAPAWVTVYHYRSGGDELPLS